MAKSSQLPNGGLVPTLGSNYMMDGYEFDGGYGEGVDSAHKTTSPPRGQRELGTDMPRSTKGLAGLPDGFVDESPDSGFDFNMLTASDEESSVGSISAMVRSATRLNDLAWLESATQDPTRLPEKINSFDVSVDDFGRTMLTDAEDSGSRVELESAWGVNSRTDGQNLVPNVEYPRPVTGPTSAIGGDQFREIVAHAMRQSTFGRDLKEIGREVLAFLGTDPSKLEGSPMMRKLTAAMRAVRAEHGLVGNVYVRDSAFPKLLSGKWDDTIKKRCASARYFLTTPGSKLSAYDNYLGKKVVTQVPWAEAADHYRSVFASGGRKLASGDPRAALRAAFLAGPEARVHAATNFPTHVHHAAEKKADKAPVVKDPNRALRAKADVRIARWVKAGLLSPQKAVSLQARFADPYELYRKAAEEVAQASNRAYTGSTFHHHQAERSASHEERPAEVNRLLRWASQQMTEGSAGNELDQMLNARFSKELLKQASEPLVQLRQKHEGLSGHLYVEASAYASPTGTTGCEKGALIHRANAIRAVLGMDRCNSCTANVDGRCQKYAKLLVASAPTPDPAKYQAETIRVANDPGDRMANLFTTTYDSSEYGLRNDVLDDIEYDDALPAEDLGRILFASPDLDLGEE